MYVCIKVCMVLEGMKKSLATTGLFIYLYFIVAVCVNV